MKKVLTIFILLCCISIVDANAQTLHIQSFIKAERDISARTNHVKDINDKECALLKVRLAIENARFDGMIAQIDHKLSEYWVYLSPGSKRINITLNGYLPLIVVFGDYGFPQLESLCTYIITIETPAIKEKSISPFKPNGGYVEGNIQIGSNMAIGGTIGFYMSNINVEASYLMGLSKSEDIYWNSSSGDAMMPSCYTYKPTCIEGKVGYGVLISNKIRITPQLGISVTSIRGNLNSRGETKGVKDTYVSTAAMGARFHFAIFSKIGICIAPEYSFGIAKGKAFDTMAEASSKIKGLENGFNCKFGINVLF